MSVKSWSTSCSLDVRPSPIRIGRCGQHANLAIPIRSRIVREDWGWWLRNFRANPEAIGWPPLPTPPDGLKSSAR